MNCSPPRIIAKPTAERVKCDTAAKRANQHPKRKFSRGPTPRHPSGRNKSILFVKQIGKVGVVIVSFDEGENGKIVLHKSFFNKMKAGRFNKLPSIKLSSEVGNPSISHASEKHPPFAFPLLKTMILNQISSVLSMG